MAYSMDDALKVVIPHLSAELVPPESLLRIRDLARLLAPIYWGGFECRLGKEASRVDFHQGIETRSDASKAVSAPISSINPSSNSGWRRIQNFCREWNNPSSPLCTSIAKMGLEFDVQDSPFRTPAPSVFMALEDIEPGELPGEQLLDTFKAVLSLLLGSPVPSQLIANLSRCLNSCPDGAAIFHFGTMLARPVNAVRVNTGLSSPEQLAPILHHLGWKEIPADLEEIVSRVTGFVEKFVLCLDIGAEVYPRIGLECFSGRQDDNIHQWTALLDLLAGSGLCTPGKRDALLDWPGITSPVSSSGDWPGDLIIASILKPPDAFSRFHRNLNHIKIDYQPGRPLEAKGYIEFIHKWV